MTEVIELTIPSSLKYLKVAGELLKGVASFASFDPGDVEDIWLAFHEVLVNAIRHGNREDANKRVFIRLGLAPRLIEIEVLDQGRGFNPANLRLEPTPESVLQDSGRGLFLVRHFMDSVTIDSRPGSPTRIRMTKRKPLRP